MLKIYTKHMYIVKLTREDQSIEVPVFVDNMDLRQHMSSIEQLADDYNMSSGWKFESATYALRDVFFMESPDMEAELKQTMEKFMTDVRIFGEYLEELGVKDADGVD